MKKLSRKAKIYILTTILAGAGLMAWLFGNTSWKDPWMLAALSGLASLSLIIKVDWDDQPYTLQHQLFDLCLYFSPVSAPAKQPW